jgi:Ca2+-transporting ATPase
MKGNAANNSNTVLFGLGDGEAKRRIELDGPNELPRGESRRLGRILAEIVSEPMVFLLIGCGAIYFILGDPQEASMLLGFLVVILGITIYQEQKAEKALEALRDLSSPRALVVREGRKQRIAGRELVLDDIILLNEGDKVPADADIFSAQNLSVDESLLTGESVPVNKIPLEGAEPTKVFAGTTVVRGSAIAKVTATGPRSELGKIGKAIAKEVPEHTRLQNEARQMVRTIAIAAGILCLAVVVAFALTRQDWVGGLLAGLTLAMAILPNELPAVLTIFLALGAWRLSQNRVLTRRSAVIEALGAATVLCVDKTGTLTHNRMAVRRLWNRDAIFDLKENTGRALPEEFHEIIEYGILAGEREAFDPMDKAFQKVASDLLVETDHLHPDWTLVQQYPLTPNLLALSHAWKSVEGVAFPVAAKGAPEAITDLCHLPPEQRTAVALQVKQMGEAGLRVLGVARARFEQKELPAKQHDFDFEFLGLVGLQDPIREEVPQAVAECHSAGIRVMMITGDHPDTAKSIAREIRLPDPDNVVTGDQMRNLTDSDLKARLRSTSVCARMVPEQKLRLISLLKEMGEVVAMTGDGVNDAPALRSAHVGIAMGARGTDVARESASLVLLDDDFGSIVTAVRHGRRIFENLSHATAYLLAVHIPITGISVIPIFFNLPLVLLPIHIAFLHLIIEPACSVAFEAESESTNLMNRPPRGLEEKLFSKKTLLPVLWMGGTLLVVLLVVFLVSLRRGLGELDARTLTFTTLVLANIGLLNAPRSKPRLRKNRSFLWLSVASLVLLGLVLFLPTLRELFKFSVLHLADFAVCLIASAVSTICFVAARKSVGARA